MIKLSTKHEPLTVSYESSSDLKPAHRLIVPILDPETDLTTVIHRVWELANATGSDVKFIGLCNESIQELVFRRTLVTIAAMMNDDHVYADSEIVFGRDWVSALKSR